MNTEQMQNAANTMYQSADRMMSAANSMSETFHSFRLNFDHQIFELNKMLERLEKFKEIKPGEKPWWIK